LDFLNPNNGSGNGERIGNDEIKWGEIEWNEMKLE